MIQFRSASGLNCPQHPTATIGPSTIRGPAPPARALALKSHAVMSPEALRPWPAFPAAILARMLGIHINVATAWQRASAGDWAA
jgi:hypothetical protein